MIDFLTAMAWGTWALAAIVAGTVIVGRSLFLLFDILANWYLGGFKGSVQEWIVMISFATLLLALIYLIGKWVLLVFVAPQ